VSGRGLGVAILVLAGAATAWNAQGLIGHERAVRAKNLDFLPSPAVARVLACGHPNSASRLRWIDAFAYFQFQLDRKDDTVAGGASGFERLYDMLIGLDPRFEPFYQHASLCLGGVAGRHQAELAYLQRGTFHIPTATALWRTTAAVLVTHYHWDRDQTANLGLLLAAWADAERDDGAKTAVWQWQAQLARRRAPGLEEIPYWLDQLRTTSPGSAMGDFVEGILREQIARYGIEILTGVANGRRAAGEPVATIADLLDPPRLAALRMNPQLGPVVGDAGSPRLSDPFGHSYAWRDGVVISPGLELRAFVKAVRGADQRLQTLARERGGWPEDLAGVSAHGVTLPALPAGAAILYRNRHLLAELPKPSHPPLTLR